MPQLYLDRLAGVIRSDSLLEILLVFISQLLVFVANVPWPTQKKDEPVSP